MGRVRHSSGPHNKCRREGQSEREREPDGERKRQRLREQPRGGSGLRRARLPVPSACGAQSRTGPPSCQSSPARRPAVRTWCSRSPPPL
eukprot:2686103-Rhodomonas_salina.1